MDFSLRRTSSTFIDHLIFSSISGIISFPGIFFEFLVSGFGVKFLYGNIYLNTLAMAVYVGKDLLMPTSPGKKLMKLTLASQADHSQLKAYQLLLRNLTFLISPIEVILEFNAPYRRLGDKIAGTTVVEASNSKETTVDGRVLWFIITIFISFVFQMLVKTLIDHLNLILS